MRTAITVIVVATAAAITNPTISIDKSSGRVTKDFTFAVNTVFLLLTALIHNFYKTIMSRLDTKAFGLKKTSRIKAFVFRFITVPAKWIKSSRQHVLNIYTCNNAYAEVFQTDFG